MDWEGPMLFLNILFYGFMLMTALEYWWGTRPVVEELWARRVLGDDVYNRATKPTTSSSVICLPDLSDKEVVSMEQVIEPLMGEVLPPEDDSPPWEDIPGPLVIRGARGSKAHSFQVG